MSRGPGRIQRALLEVFKHQDDATTFELASRAYNIQPNEDGIELIDEAQLVATRRALAKLAKQGLVFDLGRSKKTGRRFWASQREGLYMAILFKKIQIGSRHHTPKQVEEFKRIKGELIFHAKDLGHWPYIRARHRESLKV